MFRDVFDIDFSFSRISVFIYIIKDLVYIFIFIDVNVSWRCENYWKLIYSNWSKLGF